MMAIQIRTAQRKRQKFRGALIGPTGSGKTYTMLRLLFGLSETGKVCMIDTERGSGELYADVNKDGIGEYLYIGLEPPFTCEKYGEAIAAAVEAGCDAIGVDSLSHAWIAEGGLLEKKGAIESRTGNGWTAWKEPTKDYNALVTNIISCPVHIICTLRAKMDYVQEKDEKTNRTTVRKVGMGAQMRDGIEYEFTVTWDLESGTNMASCTKDRTTNPKLFQGQIKVLTEQDGIAIRNWLMSGAEVAPKEEFDDALDRATKEQVGEINRLLEITGKVLPEGKTAESYTKNAAANCINSLLRIQASQEEKKKPEAATSGRKIKPEKEDK